MNYKNLLLCAGLLALSPITQAATAERPNIVYILADDLGYGDVHCLNPERGKIKTPHLDQLAGQGVIFTDAHSSSAVCTPSRYSILTGRYNWRSRLQKGVMLGYGKPLIAKDRLTVPALLRNQGYTTACIGKWHLGMDLSENKLNSPIDDGPTSRGFDYFFGISASLDMPPFAFIENNRFTEAPTTVKKWVREGAAAPGFQAVDVLPALVHKAAEWISRRTSQPSFLYLALTSPHTPLVPTKEWQGKSGLGDYGDFLMETDWAVGEVIKAIDASGAGSNTLVIVTSDNGCARYIGVDKLEAQGHFPSAQFRGYKPDIYEGGHRIPFIARWPNHIKPGTKSDQLTCLVDLIATCADIVGVKLPANAGEDSVSILPALLGKAESPLREAVVNHSGNGSFAIREGRWKLEICADSRAPHAGSKEPETLPPAQLYDLTKDEGERLNQASAHPEIVERLTKLLERYIANGRSTAGPLQTNDTKIVIQKMTAMQQSHSSENSFRNGKTSNGLTSCPRKRRIRVEDRF